MRKKLIVGSLISLFALGVLAAGCGQSGQTKEAGKAEQVETVIEETKEVVMESSVAEEVSEEESTEVISEEERLKQEMESWLSQPDNEEWCVAVWNELTGDTKVFFAYGESSTLEMFEYDYQEGDRVAIPARDNIGKVVERLSVPGEAGLQMSDILMMETKYGGYYLLPCDPSHEEVAQNGKLLYGVSGWHPDGVDQGLLRWPLVINFN